MRDWWTPEDAARFDAQAKAFGAQYATYEAAPGSFINPDLTMGENIADLAGLEVSYDAYRRSLGGKPAPVIDGLTGDQRFFLGWAQERKNKFGEQNLSQRITTDPHSPSIQRTWVSRNLDPWYKAYQIKEGQKLYLASIVRVRSW